MVAMVTDVRKNPILGALIGGAVVATVSVATVLRYRSFRQLKEEIDAIPYDLEKPFSWKHFFKQY